MISSQNRQEQSYSSINASEDQKLSPYRYINLTIIILSALCNSFVVQVFSTINTEITDYLPGTSITQISLCALIFMFIHPLVILPSNYLLDTYSIKLGISINCILVIMGVCVRMLIGYGIIWVIIGNGIIAVGNVFLIVISSKFSTLWFPTQSRLIVTSLIVFSNAISGEIGAAISPIIVKSGLDQETGKSNLIDYTIIQGIVIALVMVLNLIFFRGNPQNKQKCISQGIFEKVSTTSYLQTLKKLIKSKEYLLLVCVMMFSLNFLNCFATFIEIYIIPFELTSEDAGTSTAISVGAGLIGSIVSGILIRRRKNNYKPIIILEYIVILISMTVFVISLELRIMPLYWVSVVILGATMYSILPGIIQFTCERMSPIGQASVTGFMIGFGELFSFFMGILQSIILKQKTKQGTFYSFIINSPLLVISLIIFANLTKNKSPNRSLLTQNN